LFWLRNHCFATADIVPDAYPEGYQATANRTLQEFSALEVAREICSILMHTMMNFEERGAIRDLNIAQ
jgi:hypothetical protein